MNRFVLLVRVQCEDCENEEAWPLETILSRQQLEEALQEMAEEAQMEYLSRRLYTGRSVNGCHYSFYPWNLLDGSRVSPPKVLTVDEWFGGVQ